MGDVYYGVNLKHQRDLPNNSILLKCDMELLSNGLYGRNFNGYMKCFKNKTKYYIIFSKI